MSQKPKTAWMWQDDASGGVMGVTVDIDDKKMQWFDQPGCACGGADDYQTIADFLKNGSRYLQPPDDVIQEMVSELKDFA